MRDECGCAKGPPSEIYAVEKWGTISIGGK